MLRPVRALHENEDFVREFARIVNDSQGKVCSVCGLERIGHGPESKWLGHAKHEWDGIEADAAMLERARTLTSLAYAVRDD